MTTNAPTQAQIQAAIAAVCSNLNVGSFPVFGDGPEDDAPGHAAYNRGDAEVKISFDGNVWGEVLDISDRGYEWRWGIRPASIATIVAAWVRFDHDDQPYFAAAVRLS